MVQSTTSLLGKSEKILMGLLGLGMVGLLYLVIYGNLSGNLGFQQNSVSVVNEFPSWVNNTGYTLAGASDTGAASFVISGIRNATTNGLGFYNFTISTANASVSAAGVVTNATALLWHNVSLNYSYTRNSQGEIDSEAVIGNLTSGTRTFFGFSNTLFTLTAITLLIGIILVVISQVKGGRGSSGRNDAAGLTG